MVFQNITQPYILHSLHLKLKPNSNINHINRPISDLETTVAKTEDLISVLDDDVTELDVLVLTLQEENTQLQQTVNQLQLTINLLLERVADLQATDSITNNTLDGNIFTARNEVGARLCFYRHLSFC